MLGLGRAGGSRSPGRSVSNAPRQLPKPRALQAKKKKRQRNTSCGKMISTDDGRGSTLFRLRDPERESYFKGKQEDPNNAKMLTPVAPAVLFIACW